MSSNHMYTFINTVFVSVLLGWALFAHKIGYAQQVSSYAVAFAYDAQGRLTSATYDDEWVIRYTYDANNNMTSRIVEPLGPTATEDESDLPTEFALYPSYPNPFNPTTTISYDVRDAVDVNLTIYDVVGRRVATLINRFHVPGRYQEPFDARALSSGIYFFEIKMGDFREVKSMTLVR